MPNDFDTWSPRDLLHFLRVLAELADRDGDATGADAQHALDITEDAATAAIRRLDALGCIRESGRPRRAGDSVLNFGRVLTAAGVTAVLDGQLPRPS